MSPTLRRGRGMQFRSVTNSAGFLHRGSREKDHEAIIKGMYSKANGLKLTGQYLEATKVYQDLLAEYPEELDVRFFLAQSYDRHLNEPEKALKEYIALNHKLMEKKIDYKFKGALRQNIKELKQEMEDKMSSL